jgi:hypothetical protein
MPRQISFDPRMFRDPEFIALSIEHRRDFLEFVRTENPELPRSTLDREMATKLYETLKQRGLLQVK